jgi:hypothetical protein
MNTFRVEDVVFILTLDNTKDEGVYEIVVRDELEKVCYKRIFDFDDKIFEGHEFIRNAWILNHVLCEGFNDSGYINVDELKCSEENNVKIFTITVNAIIPPGNDSITIDIPCWIDDIEKFAKLYDAIDSHSCESSRLRESSVNTGLSDSLENESSDCEDSVDKQSEYTDSESCDIDAHTIEDIYKKLSEIQNDILAIQIRQEAHDKSIDLIGYLEQDVKYVKEELHDHLLEERQRRNPYY